MKMILTVLSLLIFTNVYAQNVSRETVSLQVQEINFNESYFQQDDVEILKVEQEYSYHRGGFGTYRRAEDLVVLIKVRDLNYHKGFESNYRALRNERARYLYDDGEFDVWELKIESSEIANKKTFLLDIYMPASWLSTPSIGTRSNPGYIGPSYRLKLGVL